MFNTWKLLEFKIPSEFEVFEEQQECLIKESLEANKIQYKFINNNLVFLSNDNFKNEEIDKIKISLDYYFKKILKEKAQEITIKKYPCDEQSVIYKIIFPDKFPTEDLSTIIEKEFNVTEKNFDEICNKNLEADIEENVLLFESASNQEAIENNFITLFETKILESFFSLLEYEIELINKREVMFSFEIHGVDKEENIFDYIQSSSTIEIINEDSESNIIKEIEYQFGVKNTKPLVHDIQKEHILICNSKECSELGLFFLGYMKTDNKVISITLKAFEYEIVQQMMNMLSKKFKIVPESNLFWSKLMDRFISNDYNEIKRNLEDNELCKQFLNFTMKEYYSNCSFYLLKKILKNGYLTEEEYEKKEESIGEAIKDQKKASSFLQKYLRLDKRILEDANFQSYWINAISNQIYIEKKSKTDPDRISDATSYLSTIFAPPYQLLSYIKSFWHQNYVKEIIKSIKSDWEEKSSDLQIIDIKSDMQFNLRDKYFNSQKSIDIDILIKLKRLSKNEEFIIAIETKQKSSELIPTLKDLVSKNKISYEYADIFAGFLMIAYIDDMQSEMKIKLNEPEYCTVIFKAAQEKIVDIKKDYLLSVEHSLTRLKEYVEVNIKKICEQNK